MTRESYEMNTYRPLSRGNSHFGANPQIQLRTALEINNYDIFKKTIDSKNIDLEHVYPDYKTILELAVTTSIEPYPVEFVELLLQHKVEVNKLNGTNGEAPIHFAVNYGNIKALELLLKHKNIKKDIKTKGNTALLLAIKKIGGLKDSERMSTYVSMVELLLKEGCNPNYVDNKGVTPVSLAAQQELEGVVEIILNHAQKLVNLDKYEDYTGKTARHYLVEAFPDLIKKFVCTGQANEVIEADDLFYYLQNQEEDNFVRNFNKLKQDNQHVTAMTEHNGTHTLLQLAVEKGFKKGG